MRQNTIKALLQANKTVINAWASIPSSFSAEVIANCGFDAVTVDLQHGMMDYAQMLSMFQAISTTNDIPIGRPSGSNAVAIMSIMDAGSYWVICPQVDVSGSEERRAGKECVSECRYRLEQDD